jgi:hypothetical protein
MKLTSIVASAAVVLALAAATPARADEPQNRGDHARHAQNRQPRAQARSGGNDGRGAARSEPRREAHRAEPGQVAPRAESRQAVPRSEARPPVYGNNSRDYDRDRGRNYDRGRTIVVAPRVYPRYSRPYYRAYPYVYHRPYYTFRPRLNLGFGIYIGYPVAYPYSIYPAPVRVWGYPAGGYSVAPNAYGGISFEIGPPDAEVYVDGQYVGRAGDFGPGYAPLPVIPGRHRLEVVAPGYQTMAVDVDIVPGQVIPYQGSLIPY